jgi:outer membrane receptor protein involved in Fe transport
MLGSKEECEMKLSVKVRLLKGHEWSSCPKAVSFARALAGVERFRKQSRIRIAYVLGLGVVLLLSLSLPRLAIAQSTTQGGIGGTVFDATGAVVPNASVLVHNNGTNAEKTVRTDATGNYRVTNLQPATYTITVTATGFQTYKDTGAVVSVGALTQVSPHLVVGSVATTVEVTGQAAQLNSSTPEFAPALNSRAITNLPINGGRWSEFVLLTPTVVSDGNGFGLVSFRGISPLLNNNTVDGADNNDAFWSEERGRTRIGYSTPKVAVQEFQVNTSNYSAEYGRAAGGVINTVTKSGANAIHGEGYFKDRSNGWGATNPFTTVYTPDASGVFTAHRVKPKNIRLMGGFGVGGPIIKDKLFYFVAFDRYHLDYPGTSIAGTPNSFFAAPKSSDISTLASRLGVSTAQAQTLYANGLNDLTNELGTVPRTGDQDIVFPKLDWTINDKNHASFEVNRMRWWSPAGIQTQTAVTYATHSFGNDYVADTWGVGRLTTTFTPTMANEFRLQYGRDFEYENPQAPSAYEQANFVTSPNFPGYTNPLGLPPDVYISNGFDMGVPSFLTRPSYPDEHRVQVADTLSWVHGNHTLKYGADFTRVNDKTANLYRQFGYYSYSSLVNYFSDLYSSSFVCSFNGTAEPCYSGYTQAFGPLGLTFVTKDLGIFAQDDWKFTPRLTLQLGLRWDKEFLPTPFSSLTNSAVPQTQTFPSYNAAFGPRVGFAWDIFGDGKTSLRGGYGIYYGRVINATIYSALFSSGSSNGQLTYSFSGANLPKGPHFPEILSSPPNLSTGTPNTLFFDPNFKTPQIHEMDLSLERDLGWNTVLSISYLGSLGRHLPTWTDLNIAPSTSTVTYTVVDSTGQGPLKGSTYTTNLYTTRPNAAFNEMLDIQSVVDSSYNALAIQVNHRFSKHVQFNAGYTWSHALDYNQNQYTSSSYGAGLDPYNRQLDYGNSNYNVPNRFTLNGVLESPWRVNGWGKWLANDWQLSPIVQVQNGLPYSLTTSGTAPGAMRGGYAINGSNGDSRVPAVGRNTYRYPSTAIFDLRLAKSFQLAERFRLEFMAEGFNAFNHQNYTGVSTLGYRISGSSLIYQPSFGSLTNSNSNFIYTPRQVQFGVRVHF